MRFSPQLHAGLSSEHATNVDDEAIHNADRQICAKYYVSQILGMDEDSIKHAWFKVTAACQVT